MAMFREGGRVPLLATGSHSPRSWPQHADGDWHRLGEDGGTAIPGSSGMNEDSALLVTA